jgi:uncharacterized membrane protein YdjX (TVP38/TMEM64 family)
VSPRLTRDWIRLISLVAIVLTGFILARILNIPGESQIRTEVRHLGAYAPWTFMGIYALATLIFIPKAILSIVAGATFGLSRGLVYVLVGAVIGAIIAFLASRYLARESMGRLAGRHLVRLDTMIAKNAFTGIVIVRLIPVIPFTLINYVAGLTAIGLGTFAAASAIGMLPGTFVYVSLGAFGSHPRSWQFITAVILVLVLSMGSTIAMRRRHV